MKIFFQNLFLIFLLLLANAMLLLYTYITFSPENYIWTSSFKPDQYNFIANACADNKKLLYFVYANALNFTLFGLYTLYLKKWIYAGLALVGVVGFCFGTMYFLNERIDQNYFVIYQNQSVPKEFAFQPIHEASRGIGKHLLLDIKNPSSINRGLSARALAQIEYTEAIPDLDKILNDSTENTILRAHTFKALSEFENVSAQSIVRTFSGSLHEGIDSRLIFVLDSLKYR